MNADFLVGPTAVGKTAVAQHLAERLDRDLLSADSMAVYRGMDIGTAKPTAAQRARVRTFGVDLVAPSESFSAWQYAGYARTVLGECAAQGRRAIVVGGTGLYVKALIHGLAPGCGPRPERRRHWEQVLAEEGVGALQRALRTAAPAAYNALADKANPRRLVRALEQAETGAGGADPTWPGREASPLLAGLRASAAFLHSRIESRVRAMYGRGLIEEVRALGDAFGRFSRTARQAIGYAEAAAVVRGDLTAGEAMAATAARTRRLARRQMTWFRHQARVAWIDVGPDTALPDVAERVLRHWREHGPTPISGEP